MTVHKFLAAGSVALLLAAGGLSTATGQTYETGAISLSKPWTRATPPKAMAAGGFVTIENAGESPDRLVSAASPIAGRVEIHEMRMENDTMIMRPTEGGVEIPAGGSAALEPGGLHIMFMELNETLVEGDSIPVVLTFERAGDIEVPFHVEAIGAPGPSGMYTPHDGAEHSDMHGGHQ